MQVCIMAVHAFTSRICTRQFVISIVYTFVLSSTAIAGTCIVAYLPRCLPSNMQNATAMNVTLRNGQHVVLFAYEPRKYI